MDNRIAIPVKNIIEPIMASDDARYALKHQTESGAMLQGIYQCDQYRNGVLISGGYPETPNTFTTEGMAYLNNVMWFTTAKAASAIWYVGIFAANVTPSAAYVASTALGAPGTLDACQGTTDFDIVTAYPSYTVASTATAVSTNAAAKAEFTIATTIDPIYGAFLTNDSDTTSTAGVLMSAKKFSASRSVIADDELAITYVISLTTS